MDFDSYVRGQRLSDAIGESVRVMNLQGSPRSEELLHCQSFYYGRQHDHCNSNWDGAYRDPGVNYMMERLRPQGFVPTNAIPYGARKPNVHVPLPRQIVNRFSEMLLGQGRSPSLHVPADERTEMFLNAVFEESEQWDVLVEARMIAGACGAAAIALSILNGCPMAEVLNPADLWVAEWEDAPYWKPKVVIEQRPIEKSMLAEDGRVVTSRCWRTRMWTDTEVVYFEDVGDDHEGSIPISGRPVEHGAGRCPVVWYQNTRSRRRPEGEADYAGVEHLLDVLDRIQSQTCKGTRANVDPTLVVKESERKLKGRFFQKGTGHVITVSPDGEVSYLEISGNSLKMGWDAASELRSQILQTVECVIVTPENAGAYRSGEALQVLWRSMESKCNRLRVTLKSAIQQICAVWIGLARTHGILSKESPGSASGIRLPPRVRVADRRESLGSPIVANPTLETHHVGEGSHVIVRWPPYWAPTPMQIQQMSSAMQISNGGSATLSEETSVEVMSSFVGQDPSQEKERLAAQRAGEESRYDALFRAEDFDEEVRGLDVQGTDASSLESTDLDSDDKIEE